MAAAVVVDSAALVAQVLPEAQLPVPAPLADEPELPALAPALPPPALPDLVVEAAVP